MQDSLAETLRLLRAREGLSLQAASEQLGLDRHTLRDLELGRGRTPRYPTLSKIAEGYGIDVRELLEELLSQPAEGAHRAEEPGELVGGEAEAPGRAQELEKILGEIREGYREEREEVERYVVRWERWLERGGIPEDAVEEFLVAARALYPALVGLLRSELTEIMTALGLEVASQEIPEEAKAESSLIALVDRYWELGRKLTEVWAQAYPDKAAPVDLQAKHREELLRRRAG